MEGFSASDNLKFLFVVEDGITCTAIRGLSRFGAWFYRCWAWFWFWFVSVRFHRIVVIVEKHEDSIFVGEGFRNDSANRNEFGLKRIV